MKGLSLEKLSQVVTPSVTRQAINKYALSMLALSVTVKEMVPFRVTEEARKLARAWAAMGVVLLSS